MKAPITRLIYERSGGGTIRSVKRSSFRPVRGRAIHRLLPFRVAVAAIQMRRFFFTQTGPSKPVASKKDAKSDAKSTQEQHHDAIYLIEDNGEPGGARTRTAHSAIASY